MTVYFVSPIEKPDQVKIGQTDELEIRLGVIGGSFDEGIELLAQCDGGKEVESIFHQLFVSERIEGEWFAKSERLAALIDTFRDNVSGNRILGKKKVIPFEGVSPVDADRKIAKRLLTDLMSNERAGTSLAASQERAFNVLFDLNEMWTRRRVRAIWEGCPRRIDHFEIRDLLVATGRTLAPELNDDQQEK